jgi:hypothetical protein
MPCSSRQADCFPRGGKGLLAHSTGHAILTDMAREESEREDLLREATALVERIELAPAQSRYDKHVVIGFRADGAMSLYFDTDPVYHFNRNGELRRAFCDGKLIKAEKQRLISMQRLRQLGEVVLLRHEMSNEEQTSFVFKMLRRLRSLQQQCTAGELVSVGQVPDDADVLRRALEWLADHDEIQIAYSPHAR